MTPAQVGALGAVALGTVTALVVAGLVVALAGCKASLPTPAQQVDEGFWASLDAKCLAESATKAEADKCADVQRIAGCSDGGSFADAGEACANVRLSDGGRP